MIARPWPGMMLGVHGNRDTFKNVYFPVPGAYLTGDGAYRDEDGYFWITGRIDDVINVSGHRIGSAEIESALVSCLQVAEAAVVGYPHPVKGEGIYAYVTVKEGAVINDDLRDELRNQVREVIGPIATPDVIHFAKRCPRPEAARSCVVSCARSPPRKPITWARYRRFPSRPSWRSSSRKPAA